MLQERDRLGVPLVVLAVAAPRIEADDRQQLVAALGGRTRMPRECTFCELGQPESKRVPNDDDDQGDKVNFRERAQQRAARARLNAPIAQRTGTKKQEYPCESTCCREPDREPILSIEERS